MEGQRFDEVTRRLTGALSRRRAFGALLGALAGTVVAADDADARRFICKTAGQQCSRNSQCCDRRCVRGANPREQGLRCGCPDGLTLCGTRCVDLETDKRNCGVCRRGCGSGTCCNGECAMTQTDADNCGACGVSCPGSESCVSGTCVLLCGTEVCSASEACCTGTCADLQSDDSNCGTCGNVCGTGDKCYSGECKCAPPTPYSGDCGANTACVVDENGTRYLLDFWADQSGGCSSSSPCPSGQICRVWTSYSIGGMDTPGDCITYTTCTP